MADSISFQDLETARNILHDYRHIAVVGLSPNAHRPSHYVSAYLQKAGYKIIPVNPGHDEILGETSYPSLSALPQVPEVVNVFRRSKYVADIADQAIFIGAKALWLQVGVIDEDAARRAHGAGLAVIMNLCIMVAHRRFGS